MLRKSCALVGLLFLYSCSGGGAYVDQGAPYSGRGNYYYDDGYYYRDHYHRHDGKHRGKHHGHGGGKHKSKKGHD